MPRTRCSRVKDGLQLPSSRRDRTARCSLPVPAALCLGEWEINSFDDPVSVELPDTFRALTNILKTHYSSITNAVLTRAVADERVVFDSVTERATRGLADPSGPAWISVARLAGEDVFEVHLTSIAEAVLVLAVADERAVRY